MREQKRTVEIIRQDLENLREITEPAAVPEDHEASAKARVEAVFSRIEASLQVLEDSTTMKWKTKRGEGTRDQDEFRVKARGVTSEEVAEEMRDGIEEVRSMVEEARAIQPEDDE
jgi:hypothetical protein